jgi:hypothetical protein
MGEIQIISKYGWKHETRKCYTSRARFEAGLSCQHSSLTTSSMPTRLSLFSRAHGCRSILIKMSATASQGWSAKEHNAFMPVAHVVPQYTDLAHNSREKEIVDGRRGELTWLSSWIRTNFLHVLLVKLVKFVTQVFMSSPPRIFKRHPRMSAE